jgi:hypothetical protein
VGGAAWSSAVGTPRVGPGPRGRRFGGLRRKTTNASPTRRIEDVLNATRPGRTPAAPGSCSLTCSSRSRCCLELAEPGDGRLVAAGVVAPTPRSRRRAALGRGALAAGAGPLRRHRVDVGLGPGVGLLPLGLGPRRFRLGFLGPLGPPPAGSSPRRRWFARGRAGPSTLVVSAAGWPGDAEPPGGPAGRRDSELLVRRRPQPQDFADGSRDREVSMPGLPVAERRPTPAAPPRPRSAPVPRRSPSREPRLRGRS